MAPSETATEDKAQLPELISYKLLRRMVGRIGFYLPVVLYFGVIIERLYRRALLPSDKKPQLNLEFFQPESSISFYYYSVMGDVFVGMLAAVGIFLFAYKGHENDEKDLMSDNLAGNLACVFALGVAFFPCNEVENKPTLSGVIHIICACLFFLTLAYFSLRLFTKTNDKPTPKKLLRNKIYRVCGCVILIAIGFLFLDMIHPINAIVGKSIYFWAWEVVALWAFAFSWLVKGNYFRRFNDEKS